MAGTFCRVELDKKSPQDKLGQEKQGRVGNRVNDSTRLSSELLVPAAIPAVLLLLLNFQKATTNGACAQGGLMAGAGRRDNWGKEENEGC